MKPTSYLILSMVILLSSTVHSAEWLECDPPKSFAIELESEKKLLVYDAQVKVKYNRNDLAFYKYPNFDDVNILINNTLVSFSGHILSEDEEVNINATKVFEIFNSIIVGFSRLLRRKDDTTALVDYNLYISRNRNEKLKIPGAIQTDIIHEAVSCVKSTIDEAIGKITAEDFERAREHPHDFGSISVLTGNLENIRSNFFERSIKPKINATDVKLLLSNLKSSISNIKENGVLQIFLNKIVDLAIAVLAEKMHKENEGQIGIPDLNYNFSMGPSWWSTTANFDAFDGTFEDLTTLTRKSDVSLSREGIKFTLSCVFGLDLSNIEYRSYELRYGIVNVSGKLSASIDRVSVLATGSLDFTERPCKAVLLNAQVTELGKVKVTITGLGPLNYFLSKLVTEITKLWRDQVMIDVEKKLRDIIMKYLGVFNCELYRPN